MGRPSHTSHWRRRVSLRRQTITSPALYNVNKWEASIFMLLLSGVRLRSQPVDGETWEGKQLFPVEYQQLNTAQVMIFTQSQRLWICPSWQNRPKVTPDKTYNSKIPYGCCCVMSWHQFLICIFFFSLFSGSLLRSVSGCLRVTSFCACVSIHAGVCICVLLSWRLQWRQTPGVW